MAITDIDGEHHRFRFRISGPESAKVVRKLPHGLEIAEFSISGHIVADIALTSKPQTGADGSILVDLEALTIAK